MTPNILYGPPGHQQQPAFFAAWFRRGIVDSLGWCCSSPVQFSWQIHFEPVVFFWLPFLNGLSYRFPVALDPMIIRCRLRISHNKISFIEISSSYGWLCSAIYLFPPLPQPPSKHRRKIRNRQKTYKGIFLPPTRPLSVHIWGLFLRIW